MTVAVCKFIVAVSYSKMFVITYINKSVVTTRASEYMILLTSTLPSMTACSVALVQFGTISVILYPLFQIYQRQAV